VDEAALQRHRRLAPEEEPREGPLKIQGDCTSKTTYRKKLGRRKDEQKYVFVNKYW
jgi:hypothetical protein